MGSVGRAERLIELASGIDALYFTAMCALPTPLLEDLKSAQREARERSEPSRLLLGAESFRVGERGRNRYRFMLQHSNGEILFTDSEKLPPIYVQPRARFIHAVGIDSAMRWFMDLVESMVGEASWRVSRADLFMDSHGWELCAEDRSRFVCRARDLRTWEVDSTLTGLGFGSGKTVSARIYDKTKEVRLKGSDWWTEVWGSAYVKSERVLRVEFQLRRDLIRQVGLDSPDDVITEASQLWAYLTDEWLSFRNPTSDDTRSRWPVASEWNDVRNASLRGAAIGLDRVYAGEQAGSMRKLLPALRGYLASAGAIVGAATLDETLSRVGRIVARDAEDSAIPFEQRLGWKAEQLGIAS
ncbi:hypothetical protein GCM10008944_03760 [Cytobacillus oceanisediminis]